MKALPIVPWCVLVGALTPVAAAAQVAPHHSQQVMAFSNGVAGGWYDLAQRKLAGFTPAIYARRSAAVAVPNLLFDVYPGLRVGTAHAWATSLPIAKAEYRNGGLVTITQRFQDLEFTHAYFASFLHDQPRLSVVLAITNQRNEVIADGSLFTLHNARLGGGDGTLQERVRWQQDVFIESGARGQLVVAPLPAPRAHAVTPDNPFVVLQQAAHLPSRDDSGVVDDAVSGFEWDLTGLAPGQTRFYSVTLAFVPAGQAPAVTQAAVSAAIADGLATPPALRLADEQAQWQQFFASTRTPPGLLPTQLAVYQQQLAMLRMGQVRTAPDDPGHGQVIASLPPGMWNIAWVRDGAYAVQGMIAAGMYAEARAALAFWFRDAPGRGTMVCCDDDGQPWVGAPYVISVVRYFGDGSEETDYNERGPNVEFDGFGLALAALGAYVDATGDSALLTALQAQVFSKTADVLLQLIEPATGLIRADSSIWETHWYQGGKQRFTYTQATAVWGLRAASKLAAMVGDTQRANSYQAAASQIAQAMVTHLVDPASVALRASMEQTTQFLDAAVVAAINWAVVTEPAIVDGTLAQLQGLRIAQTGPGYARNDDGGDYDKREWIAIDLWLAQALLTRGNLAAADRLIGWITDQATLNFNLIPENYDRFTADYQGEVPMIGFGAGAYVSTLWQRFAPVVPPPADPGEPPPQRADEGCAVAPASRPLGGFVTVAVWLGVGLVRRRGRRRTLFDAKPWRERRG